MKKLLLSLLLLPAVSFAQDIHFTQQQNNPMLMNPSYTGFFQGWERIGVSHKSQWVSAGTKFHTTAIAIDANFFKPKLGNRAHMGAGLVLYNDVGGESKFGTKQMLLNFSAIVPVAEQHTLSAGMQLGMGQRTGNLSALVFGNQWNGSELDPSLPSNENNGLVSFVYPDIGFGVSYRYGNSKVGFARDDATDFRIGFSYFHINKPNITYTFGVKEPLYSKFGINAYFLKEISGSPFGLEATFNQFLQGPHSETMIGAFARYRLTTGGKTTGLTRDAYLTAGLLVRINDAVAPMVGLQWKGFNFGISYDVTLSKLGQVARAGGLEFSLSFTNMDFALFKRRRH
ncbi:PorP/SprF family type IX secretion system membrane protein [Paracrocinitomix mangrovi]|uniref:PorP/SprF family type IX secretion system membrane protein n=1 Tax=Paracrocinitomix mangrovi TaxID=2862509 RepID=UPI001C8E8F03|nr:PorP/SprF family type IX secretion system membrane protein [Paracrocinitomix mangrovi]UKN00531.1 PorP/SprF family type IX secretion system membrane protein [Paracrocinitomix mangrovi]